MKCLSLVLQGADFSGAIPSEELFLRKSNIEFGWDFRNGNLSDITGLSGDLLPYRMVRAGGATTGTATPDPTIITSVQDGMGIRVSNGGLRSSIPMKTIKIDGSMKFTVMIVAGYSGTNNGGGYCQFLELGNGFDAADKPPVFQHLNSKVGMRLRDAATTNVGSTVSPTTKPTCYFVTFDGSNWKYVNKTDNVTVTTTNAELGIVADLVPKAGVSGLTHVYMGDQNPASLLSASNPDLFSIAKWDVQLSDAEIDDQYQKIKGAFNNLV